MLSLFNHLYCTLFCVFVHSHLRSGALENPSEPPQYNGLCGTSERSRWSSCGPQKGCQHKLIQLNSKKGEMCDE